MARISKNSIQWKVLPVQPHAADEVCGFSSLPGPGPSALKYQVHSVVAGEVEPRNQCWYARSLVGNLRVVASCAPPLTSVVEALHDPASPSSAKFSQKSCEDIYDK